jgi:putative two-component system response regulator
VSSTSTIESPNILVIEDDDPSRRLFEMKLASCGYRVTLAANAIEAQRIIATATPDLIVSDICLPGLDGIDLTRWLRDQRRTASVPVLLVTSLDDSQTLARGLDAGADDFLTKPVNSMELSSRVRSLLRSKSLAEKVRGRGSSQLRGQLTRSKSTECERNESQGIGNGVAQSGTGDSPSIVIIEDNRPERSLLADLFAPLGCSVETASDGQSGLALLERGSPDLIVLDLGLPDINGYELIRRVKEDSTLAAVPILVVSAMSDVADRVQALDLGADDFIVKGADRVEYQARARRLIRLKRGLDQVNAKYERAMRQAVTDSLTGTFTHGFLLELLHRTVPIAYRHCQPLSLIFGDIDHFKTVNDRFGHAMGDEVLKAVARAIRDSVRDADTVARYGGDEFVVLLPHTTRDDAARLAERIRTAVEALQIPRGDSTSAEPLRVTASLGVAGLPEDAPDAEQLLGHADEALYAAKQAGRNCVSVFGRKADAAASRQRLLLVDDEERNLRLLDAFLATEGYETFKARDGEEALDMARRCRPDIILLDGMMPRLHGFDVCRRLKQETATRLIPVVLITALGTREDRLRGIEAGADDFLTKPVDKTELLTRVRALLRSKRTTDLLEDAETVIFTLARGVEGRDPCTGGHVERVSHYAVELGRAIDLSESEVEGLRRAGIVHDIGKIVVPDAVLLKPAALTEDERKIIERHAEVGYELLRPLRTFSESLPAVRFHHERLDGSGYPLGLRGDQVPVLAQVMAIVDVYDALTSDRPYRRAFAASDAIDVLRAEAARGLHDHRLVETFVRSRLPS